MRITSAIGCAATVVLLVLTWPRSATTGTEHAVTAVISYWDRDSGHEHPARVALFDGLNATPDQVVDRDVANGDSASVKKNRTSSAGGPPPDGYGLDSTFIYQREPQTLAELVEFTTQRTPREEGNRAVRGGFVPCLPCALTTMGGGALWGRLVQSRNGLLRPGVQYGDSGVACLAAASLPGVRIANRSTPTGPLWIR